MDSSDWSNRIRYRNFDARPDTEFNARNGGSNAVDDAASHTSLNPKP
jgi:hypothetical protein